MSWRIPTIDDLAATLSQDELDAYRRSSPLNAADPAEELINRTARMVRGYCRANRTCAVSAAEGEIPESLISAAMDYAAYDVLKRLPVEVGEDRRRARASAEALFRAVANNDYRPESPGGTAGEDDPDAGGAMASSPAHGVARPPRLLD